MTPLRPCLLIAIILVGPMTVAACSGDGSQTAESTTDTGATADTGTSTTDATGPDTGAADTSAGDTSAADTAVADAVATSDTSKGDTSAPIDSAVSDTAMTDADVAVADAGRVTTLKLANFSGDPINACVRRQNTADAFTGPLFRAAGIPTNAVSDRASIERANLDLKFIPATADCTHAGLSIQKLNYATIVGPTTHRGVWYRGGSSVSGGFDEVLTGTAGKETIRQQNGSEGEPSFVPDGDAGPSVDLTPIGGGVVLLDGDVTGKLKGVSGANMFERAIKTKPGGTLTMWTLTTTFLLCDGSAPAIDGLTDCSPTLRAP